MGSIFKLMNTGSSIVYRGIISMFLKFPKVLAFCFTGLWMYFIHSLFFLTKYQSDNEFVDLSIIYLILTFSTYSWLYLPEYARNTKKSVRFILKVTFFHLLWFLLFFFFTANPHPWISIAIYCVYFYVMNRQFANTFLSWQRYIQSFQFIINHPNVKKWQHSRLTGTLVCLGCNILALTRYYYLDGHTMAISGAIAYVGCIITYLVCVSKYRGKIDRILDAVLLIVFLILFGSIPMEYIDIIRLPPRPMYAELNLVIYCIVAFMTILRFLGKTYIPDEVEGWLANNPELQPYFKDAFRNLPTMTRSDKIFVKQTDIYPETGLSTRNIKCSSCSNSFQIHTDVISTLHARKSIFCPICGHEIKWYENFDFDFDKLTKEHQELIQKIDQLPSSKAHNVM